MLNKLTQHLPLFYIYHVALQYFYVTEILSYFRCQEEHNKIDMTYFFCLRDVQKYNIIQYDLYMCFLGQPFVAS
jgi:hypothetical protein